MSLLRLLILVASWCISNSVLRFLTTNSFQFDFMGPNPIGKHHSEKLRIEPPGFSKFNHLDRFLEIFRCFRDITGIFTKVSCALFGLIFGQLKENDLLIKIFSKAKKIFSGSQIPSFRPLFIFYFYFSLHFRTPWGSYIWAVVVQKILKIIW